MRPPLRVLIPRVRDGVWNRFQPCAHQLGWCRSGMRVPVPAASAPRAQAAGISTEKNPGRFGPSGNVLNGQSRVHRPLRPDASEKALL